MKIRKVPAERLDGKPGRRAAGGARREAVGRGGRAGRSAARQADGIDLEQLERGDRADD